MTASSASLTRHHATHATLERELRQKAMNAVLESANAARPSMAIPAMAAVLVASEAREKAIAIETLQSAGFDAWQVARHIDAALMRAWGI